MFLTDSMRIMHITEALGGGIFEIVSSLSAGLADQGHEVAIAYGVRAETPSPLREAVDERIELIPTAWTERTLRASLRASRELRPAVGVWNPDVIHLHSSFAGVVGAATLSGLAPTVYTPHGYSFTMNASPLRRRAFRALERRVASRVRMVGAVSDAEAHLAREVVSAPHVRVVPNGIPEATRIRHPAPRWSTPPRWWRWAGWPPNASRIKWPRSSPPCAISARCSGSGARATARFPASMRSLGQACRSAAG